MKEFPSCLSPVVKKEILLKVFTESKQFLKPFSGWNWFSVAITLQIVYQSHRKKTIPRGAKVLN